MQLGLCLCGVYLDKRTIDSKMLNWLISLVIQFPSVSLISNLKLIVIDCEHYDSRFGDRWIYSTKGTDFLNNFNHEWDSKS